MVQVSRSADERRVFLAQAPRGRLGTMGAPACADMEGGRSVRDRLKRSTYIYKIVGG
jgi:hypothetical protein